MPRLWRIDMLSENVSILQYKIGVWGAEKTERSISDEVCENAQADKKAGKFVKSLLGGKCEELKAIQNFAQLSRINIRNMSLPYNSGAVMVPNAKLMEVLENLKAIEETFKGLVDNFIRAYPEIVERARERSASLFKEGQCPSAEEVRSKFSFNYYLEPLPNSNSFDKALGLDTIKEKMKGDLESQIERVFKHAEYELEQRLLDRARQFYERLNSDSTRKISSKFFSGNTTIISGVRSLNVRGSTTISELADTLSEINKNGEYYLNPLNREEALGKLRQILGIFQSQPINEELESALARL